MSDAAARPPFDLSGVVYLVQPAGRAVANLEDLLEQIVAADRETIFLHTQMPRLRPDAGSDPPVDDLSGWVGGVVQDAATAERLAFAIRASEDDVEHVRAAIVKVLESLPANTRRQHAAPPAGALVLLRFDDVVVSTGVSATSPHELLEALEAAERSVWFHHLIEEAWLFPGPIPIVEWLRAGGAPRIAQVLEREVASGRSIDQVRARVMQHWRRTRIVARLAGPAPGEAERAAAAHEAAERLARRLTGTDRP